MGRVRDEGGKREGRDRRIDKVGKWDDNGRTRKERKRKREIVKIR